MLNLIFHRVMSGMDGPGFARFLRAFLPVARKAPFNYLFVLRAVGLLLTFGGGLLVSNRLAEPNYDRMLAWDPDHMPQGWVATRHYLTRNWIRATATWTAFGFCSSPRSWICPRRKRRRPPEAPTGIGPVDPMASPHQCPSA